MWAVNFWEWYEMGFSGETIGRILNLNQENKDKFLEDDAYKAERK